MASARRDEPGRGLAGGRRARLPCMRRRTRLTAGERVIVRLTRTELTRTERAGTSLTRTWEIGARRP
ncbi:MAG TPA: hypothetical protein VGI96_00550 [Streptosporangiaceae bacterium]